MPEARPEVDGESRSVLLNCLKKLRFRRPPVVSAQRVPARRAWPQLDV